MGNFVEQNKISYKKVQNIKTNLFYILTNKVSGESYLEE